MLLGAWVCGLYGVLVGVWWVRLRGYFGLRGEGLPGNDVVAAVALTGHLADVTMGMVLLPVSRNSALGSLFRLSPASTFAFHMTMAYVLFALVLIHGALYAAWAGLFSRHAALFEKVYPLLNPTYLLNEVWPGNTSSLGLWKASLIFTGSAAGLIMLVIAGTSFPAVRRKHFNLFYFTHLAAIGAVVVVCLHASTMFYCTLPGLLMWLLDWMMRVSDLGGTLDSTIENVGKGWFCLTIPLPSKRIKGCACHSPLAHFYIHHSASSIRELHPFTTITHLASKKREMEDTNSEETVLRIQFLFRRSIPTTKVPGSAKKHSYLQWTAKLASLVDSEAGPTESSTVIKTAIEQKEESSLSTVVHVADLKLRLEGPYFTLATPHLYRNVLCLVAGTGLSGALAISAAFKAQQSGAAYSNCAPATSLSQDGETSEGAACAVGAVPGGNAASQTWKTCKTIWSVRETDYVDMPWFQDNDIDSLSFQAHKTGPGRPRLDVAAALNSVCETPDGQRNSVSESSLKGQKRELHSRSKGDGTWVYISGPRGFIEAVEARCREVDGLNWFAARWD